MFGHACPGLLEVLISYRLCSTRKLIGVDGHVEYMKTGAPAFTHTALVLPLEVNAFFSPFDST